MESLEGSETAIPPSASNEDTLHVQAAMVHNNGLMHALVNQVMQNRYPEMSVVIKRFRMDNKIVYLPVFAYNGIIIEALLNKG